MRDTSEALAFISTSLLGQAADALTPSSEPDDYRNVRSLYGREAIIGRKLQRVAAGLIALDTLNKALR